MAEAVSLVAELGDEAKVLAGGQSLVPMLALRLAVFDHLVDVGRIAEMKGIERRDGALWIGAATTQADGRRERRRRRRGAAARARDAVHRPLPDSQPRHARRVDRARRPGRRVPGRRARARRDAWRSSRPTGRRSIPARDFFEGFWTTSMRPDELLAGVTFPIWSGRCGFAVEEFARRHGDFAIAGAAVGVELDADDRIRRCAHRADRPGVDARTGRRPPRRRSPADRSPRSTRTTSGALAMAGLESVPSDLNGSAAYRTRVGAAMVARAWTRACAEALDA